MITLTDGKFGESVANILKTMTGAPPVPLLVALTDIERVVSHAAFVAVASWRRSDRELDAIDEACFSAGVPWCSAWLIEDRLACGPLVIPPGGPCYRCFRRRYLCHHPAPEREIRLQSAYNRDASLGAAGFAPSSAWMAASMLAAAAKGQKENAGEIIEVNLFDGGVLDTRVVPVHGCTRCRTRTEARAGGRFVDHIIPAIEDLLT